MSRLAALGLVCLLLLASCAPKLPQHQSALLDHAQIHFLGAPDLKEFPGKVVVWDADHLLISGRRKAESAPKDKPFAPFLWLAGTDGKIVWEQTFEGLEVADLAIADSATALVLLTPPRSRQSPEFHVWTINRKGEILQKAQLGAPDGMWAARLTRLSSERLLVTTWKRSADSSELVCAALPIGPRGEPLPGTWEYPAKQFFPLKDGGFLAQRERAVSKDRDALVELARLRADGSIVWKKEQPLGTVQAELRGVAETADGALLLTGVGESLFEPVLAKLDANGKLLWTKTPPEMAGVQPYNLVPWGAGTFFIAAQRPLTKRTLGAGMWDSFAAVLIDAEGQVSDWDLLPEHWTFPVGGILPLGNGRYVVSGIGGADTKQQMKQTDIALYVLDNAAGR